MTTVGSDAEAADTGNDPFAGRVINVADYGAKGDDALNDTTALRDAIAASREGDAIYFPPGRYLIIRSLVPKARQLYFSLTDAATIKVIGGRNRFPVFDVKAGPVEFHHLILDGSKPEALEPPRCARNAHAAIRVRAAGAGSVELVISSCRIRHFHAEGIRVDGSGTGSDRVIVRDSLVEDCCESGLTLSHVNGVSVEASRFERCRDGIQVAFCSDVGLDAVGAIDNRRHGIAVLLSHDWHVTDCIARGNGGRERDRTKHRGWGIAAGGGPEEQGRTPNSDFTIANNICQSNYDGGITLDPTVADDRNTDSDESASLWPQRARVSGNVCRGRRHEKPTGGKWPQGNHGIHVTHSRDVLVTGNICHQNKVSGIAVVNSARVLVQSNASYANTIGIRLAGSTDPAQNLIGANMLYDNETDVKR